MREIVKLHNGPTVSTAALALLLSLERRGITLTVDGDDVFVGPQDLLTATDRAQVRQHRDDLKAMARYVAPGLPPEAA